jgi:signal transduction histidine kinase
MNGYELCKWIIADERTQQIPVILLTSLVSSEEVLEGLACGADNFITKPYSEEYLLSSIERILATGKLHQSERVRIGVEIMFGGKRRFITADQQQMLSLLISTYEAAVIRNTELARTQDDLRTLNGRLEELVEKRTAALSAEIVERKRVEAVIHNLNEELEQRVIDRTRQLEAANRELEAFSYSVSHDLKAPLRGIDGFSQVLWEDYQNKILDEKGLNYLKKIRAATQHMSELIDDLLKLSRVNLCEVQFQSVDLSHLVRGIFDQLQQGTPHRVVDVHIREGMIVQGDYNLLTLLMTNLLDNAWKFSGRKEQSRIEFGKKKEDTQITTFFVRDNGVGFDMQHVGKLFSPFQRLHTTAEFPGTGIGLVIVRRIIERHGGHVWAEGKPGEGATVYFTLHKGNEGN